MATPINPVGYHAVGLGIDRYSYLLIMQTFNGYKIVVSHLLPPCRWEGPVVLRPTLDITWEFRQWFNDWAIGLFGGERKYDVWISDMLNTIYMHPDQYHELRKKQQAVFTASVETASPDRFDKFFVNS